MITSITLDGLELFDGADYSAGAEMAAALEAPDPKSNVMLELSGAPPWFIRRQPEERTIPLVVNLLGRFFSDRETAWEALKAVCDTEVPVPLVWTNGATSKTLYVLPTEIMPNVWFHLVRGTLIAPDPTPV